MPLISIRNNVAARRGEMTQRELAQKIGIGQTWVSMIETGKAIPTAIGMDDQQAAEISVKIPASVEDFVLDAVRRRVLL